MCSSLQPGCPLMKYWTVYWSLPAEQLALAYSFRNSLYCSAPGFFMWRSTSGLVCSGAIFNRPETWNLVSCWWREKEKAANPWQSTTLEWVALPEGAAVARGPYEFAAWEEKDFHPQADPL